MQFKLDSNQTYHETLNNIVWRGVTTNYDIKKYEYKNVLATMIAKLKTLKDDFDIVLHNSQQGQISASVTKFIKQRMKAIFALTFC